MAEEKKRLEILLVEDQPGHIKDAQQFMDGAIRDGAPIQVTYAGTLEDAMKEMKSKRYDGVISDIFFPESEGHFGSEESLQKCKELIDFEGLVKYKKLREVVTKYKTPLSELLKQKDHLAKEYCTIVQWLSKETEAPLGVLVADYAFKQGIPVVLATSTYHHGAKAQPVCSYARSKGLQLVDGYVEGDCDAEAPKKRFDIAFIYLVGLHEAKEKGLIEITEKGIESTSEEEDLRLDILAGSLSQALKPAEELTDQMIKDTEGYFTHYLRPESAEVCLIKTILQEYFPSKIDSVLGAYLPK